MTKQDLFNKIYGNESIHCDINGWMKYRMYHPIDLGFDNDEVDRHGNMDLWRPKSLQGIETNNGWIKIESEDDLPTIGEYYVITSFDEKISNMTFPNYNFSEETNKEWWLKYVTHYQPIQKPQPPIY